MHERRVALVCYSYVVLQSVFQKLYTTTRHLLRMELTHIEDAEFLHPPGGRSLLLIHPSSCGSLHILSALGHCSDSSLCPFRNEWPLTNDCLSYLISQVLMRVIGTNSWELTEADRLHNRGISSQHDYSCSKPDQVDSAAQKRCHEGFAIAAPDLSTHRLCMQSMVQCRQCLKRRKSRFAG